MAFLLKLARNLFKPNEVEAIEATEATEAITLSEQ